MPRMSWYLQMLELHAALVAASGLLFLLRGLASVGGARWPLDGRVRAIGFALDFLITLTGLSLWGLLQTSLFTQPWLALKLLLLAAYIGLANAALRAPGAAWRLLGVLGALACLGGMVLLSLNKSL
jgi:uncharacterized membrane protein SirB2